MLVNNSGHCLASISFYSKKEKQEFEEFFMIQDESNRVEKPERKASCLLWIGVILAPYIFVWLLLKPGYSKKIKIIGFGWLLIFIIIFSLTQCKPDSTEELTLPELEDTTSVIVPIDSVFADTTDVKETVHLSWEEQMPADEKKIVDVIQKGWTKADYLFSDAETYQLIKERKQNITERTVSNWLGKINRIDYKSDVGELCLSVSPASKGDYVYYFNLYTGASKNANNLIPYTIKPETPLFDKVINYKRDDIVKFSGTLYVKNPEPWGSYDAQINPLTDLRGVKLLFKFTKVELWEGIKE